MAEQIRKLAEQSAQSAVDTRSLIEGSLQEIENGNMAAEAAADSLEQIVTGVRRLLQMRNVSARNPRHRRRLWNRQKLE